VGMPGKTQDQGERIIPDNMSEERGELLPTDNGEGRNKAEKKISGREKGRRDTPGEPMYPIEGTLEF